MVVVKVVLFGRCCLGFWRFMVFIVFKIMLFGKCWFGLLEIYGFHRC